jgi:heme a synthase
MTHTALQAGAAQADRRLPLLRRMALLCAVLMLATISLSAFMRLSQAGLGCTDWPACYGQGQRALQQGLATPPQGGHAVAAARLAHRAVASLALVLVIMMVLATLGTRPHLRREGGLTLALLVLALALAALGVATPGARLPAVALGNLLGGFVMLALCWRLAAAGAAGEELPAAGLGAWALAGLGLLAAQIALGALVSASYAALACSDLGDCLRQAQAAGWDGRALNPWHEPVLAAAPMAGNPAGALPALIHRALAMLVLPALVLLGIVAWRRGRRRGGAALVLLVAVQLALGVGMVAGGLPILAVLLHNLLAALLLATLARLV